MCKLLLSTYGNHYTIKPSLHIMLLLALWVKISADLYLFLFYSEKKGFDISCKLSPLETICMKRESLFSGKNNTNMINLSSAEHAHRVVKVNSVSLL